MSLITGISYTFDNLSGTLTPELDGSMTSNITNTVTTSSIDLGALFLFASVIIIAAIIISITYAIIKYKEKIE